MSHFISWHVCKHELKQKVRNRTLWLLFALMQLLLAIALFTSWQQYQQSRALQISSQQMVEQQWLAQPDRHPHRVAHFGHFAFRAPSALSYFDIGVNNWVGNSVFLEAHRQNSANFANDSQAATLLRFSELSVANLLLFVWPLLLIALGFSTISGDQQRGTLKQMLAVGVKFNHLLFGKGFAYTLLSALFLLPVFITSLVISTASEVAFSADMLIRIGLLFLLYLAYCIFWVAVVLLVSSLTRLPKHSLTALITLWFVLLVLTPRTLADIAQQLHPHKSRNMLALAVQTDIRKVGNSHNPDDPHFSEFKQQVLQSYGVNTVEELPVNYRGLVMQEGERISAEIYQRHYQSQLDKFAAQQAFVSKFYWLNPYLAVRDLSMAISASDSRHFFDFEQQAEHHRFERIQGLNKIHAEGVDHHNDREQRVSASLWQDFPEFQFQNATLSWSLKNSAVAISAFMLITILLLGILISPALQRRAFIHA